MVPAHFCACFLFTLTLGSSLVAHSQTKTTPRSGSSSAPSASSNASGSAPSVAKPGAKLLINTPFQIKKAAYLLSTIIDSEEEVFSTHAQASSDRSLNTGLTVTMQKVSLAYSPAQQGAALPYNLQLLLPDFHRLQGRLVDAKLPGLAAYVLHVRLRIYSDTRYRVDPPLQRMFARLRQAKDDLTVSPVVLSTPSGATLILKPAAELPGDLPETCRLVTNGSIINLFRGIYSYELYGAGFQQTHGTLDLIDKPGREIACIADSETDAVCEVK